MFVRAQPVILISHGGLIYQWVQWGHSALRCGHVLVRACSCCWMAAPLLLNPDTVCTRDVRLPGSSCCNSVQASVLLPQQRMTAWSLEVLLPLILSLDLQRLLLVAGAVQQLERQSTLAPAAASSSWRDGGASEAAAVQTLVQVGLESKQANADDVGYAGLCMEASSLCICWEDDQLGLTRPAKSLMQ